MSGWPRLFDVNILVPLIWPHHLGHDSAQHWFASVKDDGWATCPITQLGCARVVASFAVSSGAMTVQSAVRSLAEILGEGHHVFWPDDLALSERPFAATLPYLQGPGQLTDRYLLALAAAHGGTFATFDRSVASGLPASSELLNHVEIVAR